MLMDERRNFNHCEFGDICNEGGAIISRESWQTLYHFQRERVLLLLCY